jgi:hypothetical protein
LIDKYTSSTDLVIELNVSFMDVLIAVWNRIVTNPNAVEIKKMLNVEMTDSIEMCFTGQISRLVNCLSGFDELVEVKISDNEQIANIISMIEKQMRETSSTLDVYKQTVTTELLRMGYTQDVVDEWIVYLDLE